MTIFQGKSHKKPSGGKRRTARIKRKYELGREPTFTRIGNTATKKERVLGGGQKMIVMRAEYVNLLNPKDKSCKKVKIVTVKENPANSHYVQRNIMNKGTLVQTEVGLARITSRPGQEGAINAVLVQ